MEDSWWWHKWKFGRVWVATKGVIPLETRIQRVDSYRAVGTLLEKLGINPYA